MPYFERIKMADKVAKMSVEVDASKVIEYVDGLNEAVDDLETACVLYSTWYDTGKPQMTGEAMAYEMVSAIRLALSRIKNG